MLYALRRRAGSARQMVRRVEFAGERALRAAAASEDATFSIVRSDTARDWARQNRQHETGLHIVDARVRYTARLKRKWSPHAFVCRGNLNPPRRGVFYLQSLHHASWYEAEAPARELDRITSPKFS